MDPLGYKSIKAFKVAGNPIQLIHTMRDLKGIPESWNMGLGGLVLDFPSLLYKGLRILMFQLSGVYCIRLQQSYPYPKALL